MFDVFLFFMMIMIVAFFAVFVFAIGVDEIETLKALDQKIAKRISGENWAIK